MEEHKDTVIERKPKVTANQVLLIEKMKEKEKEEMALDVLLFPS